jgi:hypothetical protein
MRIKKDKRLKYNKLRKIKYLNVTKNN